MVKRVLQFETYEMRVIGVEDIADYYMYAFETPDKEANYFTGTIDTYTKEEIEAYVKKVVGDRSRYDYLIWQNGELIGEVVLNHIHDKKGHYRICIFDKKNFAKGIGYKATKQVIDFAFTDLELEAIDLEVFPFNKRAIALYEKLGFKSTGEYVDEDAVEPYRIINQMTLEISNWRSLHA